jgi:PilZ domain
MSTLSPIPETRSSVRFPLHLPVAIRAEQTERKAETLNISAGGVLIEMNEVLDIGSRIEFTIYVPGPRLGSSKDVLVSCVGRVVRCSPEGEHSAVAAVIDEYQILR